MVLQTVLDMRMCFSHPLCLCALGYSRIHVLNVLECSNPPQGQHLLPDRDPDCHRSVRSRGTVRGPLPRPAPSGSGGGGSGASARCDRLTQRVSYHGCNKSVWRITHAVCVGAQRVLISSLSVCSSSSSSFSFLFLLFLFFLCFLFLLCSFYAQAYPFSVIERIARVHQFCCFCCV